MYDLIELVWLKLTKSVEEGKNSTKQTKFYLLFNNKFFQTEGFIHKRRHIIAGSTNFVLRIDVLEYLCI